jgi:integrase
MSAPVANANARTNIVHRIGQSPKRRSAPNTVNGTVPPPRIENVKRRPRKYLTFKEVGRLLDGARVRGRYGHRDATMILVGYSHGLRVSELCALRWDQVDFDDKFRLCRSEV